MNSISAKVARLIKAVEWLADHRTGDEQQRHDLLSALYGPEWALAHPVFERNDGG